MDQINLKLLFIVLRLSSVISLLVALCFALFALKIKEINRFSFDLIYLLAHYWICSALAFRIKTKIKP